MDYDPHALPAGTDIHGYRIVRALGAGGFGITYEAFGEITRRRVAIKEFFPRGIASRESSTRLVYSTRDAEIVAWALDRFQRSTTDLCELKHPNIVEVIHYVKDNNTGYMIMEYVEGETLESWLRARSAPPSPTELRPLIEPILDAIVLVHSTGRIHRDIAPDNIMIRRDGRPVLIDFGAIKAIEQRTRTVQRSFAVAKANYSPPEQLEDGVDLARSADVYALGAVLYRAFANVPPVDAEKRTRDVAFRGNDPYVPLAEAALIELPADIAHTVDRALAFRAKDRLQSIDELRRGLAWGGQAIARSDEETAETAVVSRSQQTEDALVAAPEPAGSVSPTAPGGGGGSTAGHRAERDAKRPQPWFAFAALAAAVLIGGGVAWKYWLATNSCTGAETHWRSAEAIGTQAGFDDHLARYPECAFAGLAKARIAALERERRAQEGASEEQRKQAEARRAEEERQRAAAEEQKRRAEEERQRAAAEEQRRRAEEEAVLSKSKQSIKGCALCLASENPKDWVMPTGNYANHRYSQLKQITADNVGGLQVAWMFSTGVLRGHEGAPLVIGDVMYVHTPFPNIVHALDLRNDGKILWKHEPKQDPNVIPVMCCDTVNRGVAYGDGKIFLHQADTTLVALDARTGNVVWSVKNGDPAIGETGTSAPMVAKDKVIIGISGGEFGARGSLTAYDVRTGRQVWRGYSMGPDRDTLIDPQRTTHLGKPVGANSGTNTWQGDQWKIGGGTTWGWLSYDPELNLMYYGTGNPSTWNPKQRPGDNRWSATIIARDVDTGMARWVYQMTPHDEWDYEGVNEMILADQSIGGTIRKTLVHFDRSGFAYTLDRTNGELLVAEKYSPKVNWATGIQLDKSSKDYGRPLVVSQYSTDRNGEDRSTKGVCPAALGTKNQQPAAFSPDTGLFYVPTNHLCMDYEPFRVSYTAGQPYVGAQLAMYPPPGDTHLGNFIAWDARTGKLVWSTKEQFAVWSGALATAGGVVFYGTLEGHLKAVNARTGRELFRFKAPSGIVGNVMTYEHRGRQYVAVLSGVGGWAGIGLAAGLTNPGDGLGAVGAFARLRQYTSLGGQLIVLALPSN